MPYDLTNDPYIESETDVLRNLLGITSQAELETAEANLSAVAIASLGESPIIGNFDFEHIKAIHRSIFKDIFDWAGELRTVELDRGETHFANAEFLQQASEALFEELHRESLLKDLGDEAYVRRLAHYYSEINILHPFREGNGRTQRAFFSLFAAQTSRSIAWDKMDPPENVAASIAAYQGDEDVLVHMLTVLISRH